MTWPGTEAETPRPARRLASHWLAHGLTMAMATGCASSPSSGRDANAPSVEHPPAEAARIVLPDVPGVDTQPLPSTSCSADGGQNAALDASCASYTLGDAVSRATNGSCMPQESSYNASYAVEIDCEGRAIELLKLPDQTPLLSGAERQAWLDSVANDRWPCFAGQSVQFACMVLLLP